MTTYAYSTKMSNGKVDLNSTRHLVDSSWETLDPTPDVHSLFRTFNVKFFAGRLSCVELEWSVKMYQCAGICYSRRSHVGMSCVIRLSEPLLKLRSRKDLVETLLHEMIHAWNFIRGISEENGGHGQNFLAKMHEINRLAGTNISVYHKFHDEVDLYKTHWWRCDGVCKDRSPYYGFVKRTCNRTPGPNDSWWKRHEQTCGGKFVKCKEPEKPLKKKKSKENDGKTFIKTPKITHTSPGSDIRKFFIPKTNEGGSAKVPTKSLIPWTPKTTEVESPPAIAIRGQALGGKGSGRSRLLDMFADHKTNGNAAKKAKINNEVAGTSADPIVINDSFNTPIRDHKSYHDSIKSEMGDDDDDIILIDDEFDDNFVSAFPNVSITKPTKAIEPVESERKVNCPVCNISIQLEEVNVHLDQCLSS